MPWPSFNRSRLWLKLEEARNGGQDEICSCVSCFHRHILIIKVIHVSVHVSLFPSPSSCGESCPLNSSMLEVLVHRLLTADQLCALRLEPVHTSTWHTSDSTALQSGPWTHTTQQEGLNDVTDKEPYDAEVFKCHATALCEKHRL